MQQTALILTGKELEDIISRAVKRTVNETLPDAIRKATRKKWLTTEDVMEILQVSRRTVQHLRDSEQLPYHQNARTIRYDIEDVEAFLNDHRVEAKPQA